MHEKQANTVNRLKEYIIEYYDPQMIILYGSAARGDTDEFSDIDLMVIMDIPDCEKAAVKLLSDTDHIEQNKHITIKTTAYYYNQKDIPGTMVYSAMNEGRILYKRSKFNPNTLSQKSYEDRKRYVIQREYIEQINSFLDMAKSALVSKQVYRCRDYLRFSVARMLKAVLVFRDIHPPRSIDLKILYENAVEQLPGVEKFCPLIYELDSYYPKGNISYDIIKCKDLVYRTALVVDGIASFIS